MIRIIIMILFIPYMAISQISKTIEEAIEIAIKNNLEIKSSGLNIEKENSLKLRSFNIPKPELFLEYEGVNGSLSNAEDRKIGIKQDLEFPSIYFLRSDVQNSQIEVAKEELKIKINNIKKEVKSNYNHLLLLKELLKISKENFKIYEEFLFTAEKKFESGETSNLEVLGAKINKLKFGNEIKNLESEIKSMQSEIKKIMNVDYTINSVGEIQFSEYSLTKETLIMNAVNNNPDLKMLNYRKEKFSDMLSLSKGELLPDISLKYFRQKIGDNNNYWGMEVGLGIPLWFWWEPSGKIKESDFELQIASSEETQMKNSLENEINRAYEEFENNLRQVKFFNDEALKESEEILRQSKISYEEGEISYVEYLQALDLSYETITQYLHAIYNYNQTIINLEKLIAGDIK